MNLNVTILGADQLKRAFSSSPKIVQSHLKDAVDAIAKTIEQKAKINAPHKTSALRGSIHTTGPFVGIGGVIEARVGTDLEYGKYQEYGTGIYGEGPGAKRSPIRPKTAGVLAWKQNGKWVFARQVSGVRPKRYFQRARQDTLPLISGFLKDSLIKITTELSR